MAKLFFRKCRASGLNSCEKMCVGCPRLRYVVDKTAQPPLDVSEHHTGNFSETDVASKEDE